MCLMMGCNDSSGKQGQRGGFRPLLYLHGPPAQLAWWVVMSRYPPNFGRVESCFRLWGIQTPKGKMCHWTPPDCRTLDVWRQDGESVSPLEHHSSRMDRGQIPGVSYFCAGANPTRLPSRTFLTCWPRSRCCIWGSITRPPPHWNTSWYGPGDIQPCWIHSCIWSRYAACQ